LIKLCRLGEFLSFEELLGKIEDLEKRLSTTSAQDEGLETQISQATATGEGKSEEGGPELTIHEKDPRQWGEFLDYLLSKNNAMANVLKEWHFVSLSADTLEIARGENSFSAGYLDEPERLDRLGTYVQEFFERQLKIRIVNQEVGRKIDRPREEKAKTIEKEHAELPRQVQDILHIFQGEIVEGIPSKDPKHEPKEKVTRREKA
jgi:DNA polymerase-3 subunit gamma/tau